VHGGINLLQGFELLVAKHTANLQTAHHGLVTHALRRFPSAM
jgi:hypothetical protein